MNEKDLFGAAVRLLGLYGAVRGFNDLLYTTLFLTGTTNDSVTKSFSGQTLVYGAIFFLGGLYLMRGASLVQKFAFPYESESKSEETENEENSN